MLGIFYTYWKKLGFSKGTFSRVIRTLVGHGFIDPIDKGGLRGHGKSCSRFRISKRWEDYGTKEFVSVRWEEFKPKKVI